YRSLGDRRRSQRRRRARARFKPGLARPPDRQRAALRCGPAPRHFGVARVLSHSVLVMFGLAIGHLSVLLAVPVLGAVLLIFAPRQRHTLFTIALIASGLDFLWSVKIFTLFDAANG